MDFNILCTSKPSDGLLYYSYEYCCYMNDIGIDTQLVIICHPGFSKSDYDDIINCKYVRYSNVTYDPYDVASNTIVMGRSMITIGYGCRDLYTSEQYDLFRWLLSGTVVAVYSENHVSQYQHAIDNLACKKIVDVCDHDVYYNGIGNHFEKVVYFDIHRPVVDDVKFKYMFNGTNKHYYTLASNVIHKYNDHGILVYNNQDIDTRYNNVIVPVDNLLGSFQCYVYTKDILDPAPRIIQECKYHNKQIIVENRNRGLDVYIKRELKQPDVKELINVG